MPDRANREPLLWHMQPLLERTHRGVSRSPRAAERKETKEPRAPLRRTQSECKTSAPQFAFEHVYEAFRDQEDAIRAIAQIDSADIEYRFIRYRFWHGFNAACRKTATNLLPMTGDPYPAAGPANPMTFYPHSGRPWSHRPTARYPHIIDSGPPPITTCPDIPRPRGHRLRFNPNGGRSPGHHHLPGWASCCHFLRGCRRGHRRWFLGAADEEKRGQRQCINAFSHISLLAMDSFCTTPSALFKSAIAIFLCA